MSRRHPFGRGHPTVTDPGVVAALDLGITADLDARGVDVEWAEA